MRSWNRLLQAGGARGAELRDGALIAPRRAGQADLAAELHKRLIELPGAAARQQRFGDVPEEFLACAGLGIIREARQAAEEPHGVGFEDWLGDIEGDRGDGARGVTADAG